MSPTSSHCSTPCCCHECSASALRFPYSAMRYFSATLPLLLWVPLPSSATVDACGSCPSPPPSASTACLQRDTGAVSGPNKGEVREATPAALLWPASPVRCGRAGPPQTPAAVRVDVAVHRVVRPPSARAPALGKFGIGRHEAGGDFFTMRCVIWPLFASYFGRPSLGCSLDSTGMDRQIRIASPAIRGPGVEISR
jgi:hypothetical protein